MPGSPLRHSCAWWPWGQREGGAAVGAGAVWLALVGLIILTKYAFYPNALHIRTTQALLLGVALGAPAHPAYPVLMLVGVGGLIWQSQRRLRAVLNQQ